MKTTSLKRFDGSELSRFVAVMKQASDRRETRWIGVPRSRDLQIYINQQDMSFLVGNDIKLLTEQEIYTMFPELKDDVVDASAPLTQTTPLGDNNVTNAAQTTTAS